MYKNNELIKAIILLPGSALLLIPGLILYFTRPVYFLFGNEFPKAFIFAGIALVVTLVGLFFAIKTVALFVTIGDGTPGPWAPPKHFVVRGPYCYVRNPMLLSVLSILLGEGIFFGSFPILIWCGSFWFINTIYFIWFEEPGLEKRFGGSYLEYKKNVRRWIPRFSPWEHINA